MSDEKPTSIWKKELSFKRKPAEASPEAQSIETGPAETPAEPASAWKKEISLRRKPKEAPTPETVALVAPEPVLPEPVEPVAVEAFAAPPEFDHSWLTQPLEEVSTPDEAQTVEQLPEPVAPVEWQPPAAVESVLPAELDPALTFTTEPVPVPEEHLPELQPDALLEAPFALPAELVEAAAALLAPVPEQEAEPAGSKPFYKRELSFRRSKAEPAAPAVEPGWDETDTSKPFYKRELSLGRRTKAQAGDAPKAEKSPKPAPKVARERPKLRRVSLPRPAVGGGKGAKKLVGLKIGASQIAAARVANGTEPELLQVAREPLEPGIVVGGELRDPEALAVALKDFFRKHNLPKRGVRLGIANNRIGVRTFEVAGIDDPKQLANAIRFRAQEVLPIPIEEAVLDYHILSESKNEEGGLIRRVLLVVAYRELVDRYVHACRKAGIQIVGIDLEAFALLRALAEPRTLVPGDERGALVAVSVGHDRSTFAVSDGRICEFTRVLEWGGWALNVAIARALDLSPSEAEPVKRALSFSGTEQLPEGFDESQLETARDAARKQLQSFARELVSSLQFYQNQPGSLGIGEIVLTGGTTHLPGFAAELERLIGVPVRVGDPLARVKVSKRIRESDQTGSLAIAIGLGIED